MKVLLPLGFNIAFCKYYYTKHCIVKMSPNKWNIPEWDVKPKTKQNKRPMGHIAHLRKQFKSINTYDYIITLIKRRKKPIINFIRIYFFFIWRNLNLLHPKMLCAEIGWNWLSGSGEDFFNFVNVISRFRNYLPFERAGFSFEQTYIPFTQGCFVPSLVQTWIPF